MIVSKSSLLILLLTLCLMTGLLIESSHPPLPILGIIEGFDKVAHFSAFACLSLLICALFLKLSAKKKVPILSAPLLVTSLFGIIEESYQILIPTRTSSLYDLLADILGAVFAIFVANQITEFKNRNSKTISE